MKLYDDTPSRISYINITFDSLENINPFSGIAKKIGASCYGVYAIDHPGCFGLTEGLHDYISNFSDIVENVIEQRKIYKAMLNYI